MEETLAVESAAGEAPERKEETLEEVLARHKSVALILPHISCGSGRLSFWLLDFCQVLSGRASREKKKLLPCFCVFNGKRMKKRDFFFPW